MRTPQNLFSLLLLGSACLVGCERQAAVSSYQAPKEPPRSAQMAAMEMPLDAGASATPVALSQSGEREEPRWTMPDGWKPGAGDPMRFATILVNDAKPPLALSVIGLPPQPLLPNVNRWEQQMGLPPTPEAGLGKVVQHIDVGKIPVDIIDLTSKPQPNGQSVRMLAAMVPHGPQTWFFKMVGPADQVAAQKANFDKFIRSLSFAPPAPPASMPALPQATGGMGLSGWKTPPGWQQQQVEPPRIAMFLIGQAGKQAEMVVQKWPAAIFADQLSNINRWRTQVGLAPVADVKAAAPQPVDIDGSKGSLYDFAGPQVRMIVGVLTSGNEVWFFKLTGPADVVGTEKPALESFLKSVTFSGQSGH